jgi:hypothetical protein
MTHWCRPCADTLNGFGAKRKLLATEYEYIFGWVLRAAAASNGDAITDVIRGYFLNRRGHPRSRSLFFASSYAFQTRRRDLRLAFGKTRFAIEEREMPQDSETKIMAPTVGRSSGAELFKYDVFLCHNRIEKPFVKMVADALQIEAGVLFFLDEFAIPASVEFMEFMALRGF